MFNKDFIKNLTILYVEDEDIARTQLSKVLKRLFKKVIEAKNGLEGYQRYQEEHLNETPVDLILSDINMPKMSGIEMLEKIREHDNETPIIFTTARTETEYLLKAIALNTNHYVLKPINIEDVIEKIQKVCEKKYYENIIYQKTKELKEYLKIINNVAAISKMDETGRITFANSLFLESIKYTKEEILEKNFIEILSNQLDKSLVDEIWKKIKDNQIWNSNLKYSSKTNDVFFIKSTIFKIVSENKNEYINIGFISTEEMKEKRELHKKFLHNITDTNIKVANSNDAIKQLEDENKEYLSLVKILKQELLKEKQKHVDITSQIQYYENEILNVDERVIKNLKIKNSEIEDLKNTHINLKNKNKDSIVKINELSHNLTKAGVEIEKLEDVIDIKKKRITDLNEIIKIQEVKLKKYDS